MVLAKQIPTGDIDCGPGPLSAVHGGSHYVMYQTNPQRISADQRRAEQVKIGAGADAPKGAMGPISNANQWNKVQDLIQKGIDEGATLVTGGLGRPEGFNKGYFAKPTVFANVTNDMTIAREEIFGPVLCILPYDTEEDAIRIANDTVYGLSGYVQSSDLDHARKVANQIRAGNVHLNGAGPDFANGAFGGYKQSGIGREWGDYGFEEFLEVKAVLGHSPA